MDRNCSPSLPSGQLTRRDDLWSHTESGESLLVRWSARRRQGLTVWLADLAFGHFEILGDWTKREGCHASQRRAHTSIGGRPASAGSCHRCLRSPQTSRVCASPSLLTRRRIATKYLSKSVDHTALRNELDRMQCLTMPIWGDRSISGWGEGRGTHILGCPRGGAGWQAATA
jgi:hypothetical protein